MNAFSIRAFALPLILALASCQAPLSSESETRPMGETSISPKALASAKSGPVDFTAHVRPVLEAKCVMCHNSDALPGKMDLSSKAAATRTGALGLWIVPGQPEQSLLVTKIGNSPAHMQAMPPVGQQVTTDEIAVLRKWIAEGAAWPAGRAGTLSLNGN